MLVAGVLLTAPRCVGTDDLATADPLPTPATEKHREGTKVSELVGSFRETGRRWTFTARDGATAYRVLENQPLERIARAISEDSQDKHWKVSGLLTEFFDENLLLLDRIERAAEVTN